MKAGFKPTKFTKKEWSDNRSRTASGSGVGKGLDGWQKSCSQTVSSMSKSEISAAFGASQKLASALSVAQKKCDLKKQKETIAGIKEYQKIVTEYQKLLKLANVNLTKRAAFDGTLGFKTVAENSALWKLFKAYGKIAHITDSIVVYEMLQKKQFGKIVEKFGPDNDYNIQGKYNTILMNTFVHKIREDQGDIKNALAALIGGNKKMLRDTSHYTSGLSKFPLYIKYRNSLFPIHDFSY